MNGAELKQTLKDGGRVFGTMITIGRSPRWVPVLSDVGLDYVVIDTEHSLCRLLRSIPAAGQSWAIT